LAGGLSGLPGVNRIVKANGEVLILGHIDQAQMQVGDVFEIHTPGGGAYLGT
jgi:5-oxoprolinase (ATP-hydrolysing)